MKRGIGSDKNGEYPSGAKTHHLPLAGEEGERKKQGRRKRGEKQGKKEREEERFRGMMECAGLRILSFPKRKSKKLHFSKTANLWR